jgi:hypothetical protein
MSYSIATLMVRNLRDVFGENDPAQRRALIDEIWHEDGVFYDPNKGVYRGRDEIDRIAGAIKATHPDFRCQPIAAPGGIGQWRAGQMGIGPPRLTRQVRPGPTSSLLGTAEFPPFICFLTSYPKLDSPVRARIERRWWVTIRKRGIDSASAWYLEPIFVDFETLDFRIERSCRQS